MLFQSFLCHQALTLGLLLPCPRGHSVQSEADLRRGIGGQGAGRKLIPHMDGRGQGDS